MKKPYFKLLLTVFAVALLSQYTAGSAITAAQSTKPTIRYAHNWTGTDARGTSYEAALNKFITENKDKVDIVLEPTFGDEHRNKVMVDLAGGNLPDVFMFWVGQSNLKPFIDSGNILDLADFLKVSKTTKKAQWSDSILADSTVGGKQYVFPLEAFKCFMLYNTALFDKYTVKPPTTYAELLAVAKVFNANNIVPIGMGSKGGNPGHLFYSAIVEQLKGGLDDIKALPTTANINTPAFLEAAKLINDMIQNKIFPSDSVANGDWGPSIVLYNQQQAAMLYTCPWMITGIKPEVAALSKLMHVPKVATAVIDPATFNVGGSTQGIVINKASFNDPAKQAAIVDFVDYLVSDYVFNEALLGNVMPAKIITITQTKLDPLYANMISFTGAQANTYPVIGVLLPGAASLNAYFDASDKLFAGDPPEEVLKQWQDIVTKEKK